MKARFKLKFSAILFLILIVTACSRELNKPEHPVKGMNIDELINIAFVPYLVTDLDNGDSVFVYLFDPVEGVFYSGIADTLNEKLYQRLHAVLFYISEGLILDVVEVDSKITPSMYTQEVTAFFPDRSDNRPQEVENKVHDLNEIFKEGVTLEFLIEKFGQPIALDKKKDIVKKAYFFRFRDEYDVTEKYGRKHYISGAMVYIVDNRLVRWDFATTIE